tara:strand:+ start:175 stop:414 length:240 start_codon:yes stop_codon:yes gene_type:complete
MKSDMTFAIFGRMLSTASMITLTLVKLCSSLTTLKILKALRTVITVDELSEICKNLIKNPMSADITINISRRFHLDLKY